MRLTCHIDSSKRRYGRRSLRATRRVLAPSQATDAPETTPTQPAGAAGGEPTMDPGLVAREPAPTIARGSFLRASAPAEKMVVGEVLPLRDKQRERCVAMPCPPLLPFRARVMNAPTQRPLHPQSQERHVRGHVRQRR